MYHLVRYVVYVFNQNDLAEKGKLKLVRLKPLFPESGAGQLQ
jgi:hypothetical protein